MRPHQESAKRVDNRSSPGGSRLRNSSDAANIALGAIGGIGGGRSGGMGSVQRYWTDMPGFKWRCGDKWGVGGCGQVNNNSKFQCCNSACGEGKSGWTRKGNINLPYKHSSFVCECGYLNYQNKDRCNRDSCKGVIGDFDTDYGYNRGKLKDIVLLGTYNGVRVVKDNGSGLGVRVEFEGKEGVTGVRPKAYKQQKTHV
jgi:hypothetical protein